MLSHDELRRRLNALRELRQLKQAELGQLLYEQDDWGKHDLGRLERGDIRIRPTEGRMRAIAHHLRVPVAWLLDEDLDQLLGATQPDERVAQRVQAEAQRIAGHPEGDSAAEGPSDALGTGP